MRHAFFFTVLAVYVWLAPTGRPAIDLFNGDALSISKRAEELHHDWEHREYAYLIDLCLEDKRQEALDALLAGAENGWASEAGRPHLTTTEAAQIAIFQTHRKSLALETGETLRSGQASLYAEIFAWIRANERVSPAMKRVFSGTPQILSFDAQRAKVRFVSADPADEKNDPVVEFDKVRGEWTWDLKFR